MLKVPKGQSESRESKKDIQFNDQKETGQKKRTNNDQQNTTQKT